MIKKPDRLRPVQVSNYKQNKETRRLELVPAYTGRAHAILQDSCDDGPYPVVVVENHDGELDGIPVERCRFLDRTPRDQHAEEAADKAAEAEYNREAQEDR